MTTPEASNTFTIEPGLQFYKVNTHTYTLTTCTGINIQRARELWPELDNHIIQTNKPDIKFYIENDTPDMVRMVVMNDRLYKTTFFKDEGIAKHRLKSYLDKCIRASNVSIEKAEAVRNELIKRRNEI